jgi:EPS-associated MarR family transcriptional regulator
MSVSGSFREDARFRVLRILEGRPELSQRAIADELGISLGGVNYCLKGLVEKGFVKLRSVRESKNKSRYAYLLTPRGIAEKTKLTARFLRRRMQEYEALKAEIEALEGDL